MHRHPAQNQWPPPQPTCYITWLLFMSLFVSCLAVSKVYYSFCRWDDKSALENNSSLLTVLKQEQHAQMHGRTTGKICNASGPRSKLPNDVLNWLAAEDDVYSSNSSSDRGEVLVWCGTHLVCRNGVCYSEGSASVESLWVQHSVPEKLMVYLLSKSRFMYRLCQRVGECHH